MAECLKLLGLKITWDVHLALRNTPKNMGMGDPAVRAEQLSLWGVDGYGVGSCNVELPHFYSVSYG